MNYKDDKRFNEAVMVTLRHEGGLTNDKNDTGGLTKYGISQAAYPHLDIKNLKLEDAKAIYYRDYWKPAKCDKMRTPQIAAQVFDIAVNSGIGTAAKLLARAVNMTLKDEKYPTDTSMDAQLIDAANRCSYQLLNNNLVQVRLAFYEAIVQYKPSQADFIKGWKIRAKSFII